MKKSWLFNVALLLVCVLCVQASRAQDDNPFDLPEGALARLGKGAIGMGGRAVAYSSDGTLLAVGSSLGIWLYDAHTYTEVALLTGHTGTVNSVVFSPDGKILASVTGSWTVLLWNVSRRTLRTVIEGRTQTITSVAFSPDGKTLASVTNASVTSSYLDAIRLWDVDGGAVKAYIKGPSVWDDAGWSFSVTFAPDGKTLATGSNDYTVRLWDVESGTLKTSLKGHTGQVSSVVFSPDGKTIASASWDSTVRLWDVESGGPKALLEGHTDRINSVAFSPDGKTIASGSDDYTMRLWEVESGTPKAILEGHTDRVSSVAFAPDGKTLASGSEDGTILLWDMSPYITPSTPTAIQSSSPLPTQTALLANFPNPFNPDTYIPYQLHAPAHVRLSIYDVRGALVREIDVGYRAAGPYLTSTSAARWDGRDQGGQHVASGVYLYRLQAGLVAQVRKMVLIK